MPQSLTNILIHAVFSTKDRAPLLRDASLRDEMHRMLGGVSNTRGCQPVIVGGVADHVHILAHLSRTLALSDWIKEIKRQTTAWAKPHDPRLAHFSWQTGYGAFSVSQSVKTRIVRYIANQEAHHHKESFQDEYRRLLKLNEINWDEGYVWG